MARDLERMVNRKRITSKNKRLITAALPYVNNLPHLGHIVGSHLPADIFARYCRSKDYEALFVGGSDENGTPCSIAAEQIGVPIGDFLDNLHKKHKEIYDWFDISYDNFSRTTTKIHSNTVQDFFMSLYDKGLIKEGSIPVFYSAEDDRFLPGRYVKGECPSCGYNDANGDQCESCTSILNAADLKKPKSVLSGGPVEIKDSDHLFLDFDKLSKPLKKWIDNQTHWRSQVKGIANGWLKEGLRERCITRDLKNGVKIPLEGYEEKVFYVWFDAPIGYVSATKEVNSDWESYWKGDDSEVFNFLGKDNIPFHTIFWPGMILGDGRLNLPTNVVGLNYLNYEGKKFSKSKNIGVFCETLPELGLPSDAWRAYLSQIIPETGDTEFQWNEFQDKFNSDLIGNYGNYVNRVINFTSKRFEGILERPSEERVQESDRILVEEISQRKKEIEKSFENIDIRRAYHQVMELSSLGNRYLHEQAPWSAIKTNPQRAKDIMYHSAFLLKSLAILSSPFIPKTAERVWSQLKLAGGPSESGLWDKALEHFENKHEIGEPELLFRKMEDKDVEIYKEKTSKATNLKELF